MRHPVSKRDLLRGAGAAAALSVARGGQAATPQEPFDLIVVGGGNSGLPAAIFAAQRGARVLVLEAAGQVGGTLFLSSGQMSAAGTKLQKSKGIEDTPQSHYDDIMRISKGTADPTLVKLAVFNAAAVFDWLTDNGFVVGATHPVTGTTHEPYSHPRYAWAAKGGGLAILEVLEKQMKPLVDRGLITVMTSTEVTDLVQKPDGTVTGVVAKNDKGASTTYSGRYVVLTCGGYTYNPAMFEKLEGARIYSQMTYPYSLGAGVNLGVKAGGYVRGGQYHTPLFGAVLTDREYPSTIRALVRHFPGDRPPWEIFVDQSGKRFVREDILSHDAYEQGLKALPGECCWVVFDDAIIAKAPPIATGGFGGPWHQEDTVAAFKNGTPMFSRADTIEGLAKAAGIDPKGLKETVAAYNRAQSGKAKDSLGRQHMPLPIAKPPFYAIELHSWGLTDYAGIAVDGQLRVIRQDGKPIPNLYAAGELLGMGMLMGQSVCGGMSVTPALTFGRLLGHEILDFRKA